ncbi:NPCBM/NEW2 domain-containing protein [Actinoplanes sp. NPDC051411]|uniref:NPCBM/NEW2 domain-containing protein n=1 Tax=Actinoplanes sp. NPDC051411 TaxID=3155522 RepID=UPI003434C836
MSSSHYSPSARHSTRAAGFVLVALVVALIAGLVLYLRYAGNRNSAVALLAGSALVAFILVIAAIRISVTHRRSRRLELENNVPPPRLHRLMELRQWLILTLGVAFFALATGAFTALRVVSDDAAVAAPPSPVVTEPPAATEPTVAPVAALPSADPAPTDDAASPSDPETSTDSDVTDTPSDTPATKYLDTEDPLDGGYNANAVTFSAQRYPRGVSFYCYSDTQSRLQWDVAGYAHFTAVAGIDDETEGAFGAVADLTFYDQDGHQLLPKPVEVSVGHPKKVSLALNGVVSLRMTCSGRIAKTNEEHDTHTSFGDPVVTQ